MKSYCEMTVSVCLKNLLTGSKIRQSLLVILFFGDVLGKLSIWLLVFVIDWFKLWRKGIVICVQSRGEGRPRTWNLHFFTLIVAVNGMGRKHPRASDVLNSQLFKIFQRDLSIVIDVKDLDITFDIFCRGFECWILFKDTYLQEIINIGEKWWNFIALQRSPWEINLFV